MIGSHNSLTYSIPRWYIMRFFSWIWKCQNMPLREQLEKVDYFDIRIRYDRKNRIRFCHGLVDLKTEFGLHELMSNLHFNGKECRVLIERGNDKGILEELNTWIKNGTVIYIVIKKGWKVIYGEAKPCVDYTYIPFYSDRPWWKQLAKLKISTPRIWARKNNPKITREEKKSPFVHFMDFVQ